MLNNFFPKIVPFVR